MAVSFASTVQQFFQPVILQVLKSFIYTYIYAGNYRSYWRGVFIFRVLVAELGGRTGLGVGVYEVTDGVVDFGEGRVEGDVGDTVTSVVDPLCSLSMVLKW